MKLPMVSQERTSAKFTIFEYFLKATKENRQQPLMIFLSYAPIVIGSSIEKSLHTQLMKLNHLWKKTQQIDAAKNKGLDN